ncbi:MAG: hypothetical protein JNK87_24135 [Bryobacterales bacterium]|nr:hypothetical protein [Bryobacterales bacterium]
MQDLELERLIFQLEEHAHLIPVRAEALHNQIRKWLRDAAAARKIQLSSHRKQETARLLRTGDETDEICSMIVPVFTGVLSAEAELTAILAQVEASNDPLLLNAVRLHFGDIRRRLSEVGVDAVTKDAVRVAQDQFATHKALLVRVREAIQLLREAASLESKLGAHNELAAVALRVDLDNWRKEFVASPPDLGWTLKLQKALEQHNRVLNRPRSNAATASTTAPEQPPQTPPPSSAAPAAQPSAANQGRSGPVFTGQTVSQLLAESREWAKLLNTNIAAVRELNDQRRKLDDDSAPQPAWNALGQSVTELRDQLRAEVISRQEVKRAELQNQINLFGEVCPTAAPRLGELPAFSASTPAAMAEYQDSLEKAQASFTSTVQLHRQPLHQKRGEILTTLREEIRQSRKLRRPAWIDQELTRIEQSLTDLPPVPADGIVSLAALSALGDLRAQVASYQQNSRAHEDKHLERTRRFAAEISAWTAVCTLLHPEPPQTIRIYEQELTQQIDWPQDAIIDLFDTRQTEREKTFAKDRDEWRRLAQVQLAATHSRLNQEFGTGLEFVGILPLPPLNIPSEPADLAAALNQISREQGNLEEAVITAGEKLRSELPEARRFLQDFLDRTPASNPLQGFATDILAEYPAEALESPRITPEGLRPLNSWSRLYSSFRLELDRAAAAFAGELEAVRSRAIAFQRDHFSHFRPALFRRAWSMIEAAKAASTEPALRTDLIRGSRELIAALERDAKRQVAREIITQMEWLTAEARRSGNEQFTRRVAEVLGEIRRNPSKIPSAALRRELQILSIRSMHTV